MHFVNNWNKLSPSMLIITVGLMSDGNGMQIFEPLVSWLKGEYILAVNSLLPFRVSLPQANAVELNCLRKQCTVFKT